MKSNLCHERAHAARGSNFLLRRQKKVTKEKATPTFALIRDLKRKRRAIRNSLRSNNEPLHRRSHSKSRRRIHGGHAAKSDSDPAVIGPNCALQVLGRAADLDPDAGRDWSCLSISSPARCHPDGLGATRFKPGRGLRVTAASDDILFHPCAARSCRLGARHIGAGNGLLDAAAGDGPAVPSGERRPESTGEACGWPRILGSAPVCLVARMPRSTDRNRSPDPPRRG